MIKKYDFSANTNKLSIFIEDLDNVDEIQRMLEYDEFEIKEEKKLFIFFAENFKKLLGNLMTLPNEDIDPSLIDFLNEELKSLEMRELFTNHINSLKELTLNREEYLRYIYKNDELSVLWNKFEESFKTLKRSPKESQDLFAFLTLLMHNFANFSDPGTGKTQLTLMIYNYLLIEFPDLKLLVVSPKSALYTWRDEILKVLNIKNSEIEIYHPTEGQDSFSPKIIITNFHQGKNLLNLIKENDYKYMFIIDEAHNLKNINGKLREPIEKISSLSKFRGILTGTPVTNGVRNIYSLFKLIWLTDEMFSLKMFNIYDALVNKNNYNIEKDIWSDNALSIINKVSEMINPLFIKMSKKIDFKLKDVKHIEKLSLYDDYQYEYESKINEIVMKERGTAMLWGFIRLRQNASNPKLIHKKLLDLLKDEKKSDIDGVFNLDSYFKGKEIEISKLDKELFNSISNLPKDYISPRIKDLMELVLNILKDNKEKVVIWSYFTSNIIEIFHQLISSGFNMNEIEIIKGGVGIMDRESIIKNMNNKDSATRILIANPMATAESISLHKATFNSVFFERDYNAGLFFQAIDRIHRYGLPENQLIKNYIFTSSSAIDIHIYDNLTMKKSLLNSLIDSNRNNFLLNLSKLQLSSDESDEDIAKNYFENLN